MRSLKLGMQVGGCGGRLLQRGPSIYSALVIGTSPFWGDVQKQNEQDSRLIACCPLSTYGSELNWLSFKKLGCVFPILAAIAVTEVGLALDAVPGPL